MTELLIIVLAIWLCFLSYKISSLESALENTKAALAHLRKYVNNCIKPEQNENIISEHKIIDTKTDAEREFEREYAKEHDKEIEIEKSKSESICEPSESKEIKPVINEQYEDAIEEENYYPQSNKQYVQNISKNTSNNSGIENMFLGNIFSIVGSIALIIGFIIFIKLLSPYIIFTPIMKTSIGLISGILMIVAASTMTKDNMKTYSEILLGTGFCILFSTVLLTTYLFKTFSESACLLLGILILIGAYIFADKQKTISMIAISLIGGYLNIIPIHSFFSDSTTFLYLIFLNLLSLIFVYRNPQKALVNLINLTATCLSVISIYITSYGSYIVHASFPIILWCIYLIYDIIDKLRSTNKNPNDSSLNWFNFAVLTIFSLLIFRFEKVSIGATLIFASLVYACLVFYFAYYKSDKYKIYLNSMLTALAIGIFFITSGMTTVICLSLCAVILSLIIAKRPNDFNPLWISTYTGSAFAKMFFVEGVLATTGDYQLILNERLYAFLPILCSSTASYLILRNQKNIETTLQSLKFIILTTLYTYFVLEVNAYLSSLITVTKGAIFFLKSMVFSILGFGYSLQLYNLSEKQENTIFVGLSTFIGFLSILTILFTGHSYTPLESYIPGFNIRFVAYATAIITSVLFAKKLKSDVFKYLAIMLGFVLIHIETADTIEQYLYEKDYLIPIMWMLYGGVIILTGIFGNKKILRECGIVIASLTVLRVFFYEMANIEMIYKLLVLMIMGITLMLISYIYNKNKGK